MPTIALPPDFQISYTGYKEYPRNIILKGTGIYPTTLDEMQGQLDAIEGNTFLREGDSNFEVSIRDLQTGSGKDLAKRTISSPEELTSWLGIKMTDFDSNSVAAGTVHPKCRFIHLYGYNFRSPLRITRSSLCQLFTYYQVMPSYLDFMMLFGANSDPLDLRYGGFCEHVMIQDPPLGCRITQLGRSGRHLQLCYNLKSAILKGVTYPQDSGNTDGEQWRIRQAAIYHQFDIVFGTTLWVLTDPGLHLRRRFSVLTGPNGLPQDKTFGTNSECFRSSLAVHLMFCRWAAEGWHRYIRWLERMVDKHAAMSMYGARGPANAPKYYRVHDVQNLQYYQDQVEEVIMVLDSNAHVVDALREFYVSFGSNTSLPSDLAATVRIELESFSSRLSSIIKNDFNSNIKRAKLLAGIVSARKELCLLHIEQQDKDNTFQLELNMRKETVSMRIITIVTLLYLPATFVSTFFSTDVVKYRDPNGGQPGNGSFSRVAMTRWLQVTVPLTFLTILFARAMYKFSVEEDHAKRYLKQLKRRNAGPPESLGPPGPPVTKSIWQTFLGLFVRERKPLPLRSRTFR